MKISEPDNENTLVKSVIASTPFLRQIFSLKSKILRLFCDLKPFISVCMKYRELKSIVPCIHPAKVFEALMLAI